MMKENRLRRILNEGGCSLSTRLWSTWPMVTEALAALGIYDYVEFVAEYAPFTQSDLENLARAAELYDMGSMIKIDLQNRAYVGQKAIGAGFQAVNFADCCTAEDVRASVSAIRPKTVGSDGVFGCPNRRFISSPNNVSQKEHIQRLNDIVLCFMIEKQQAVDNIEEICAVPGVDMVQFGPADYSMSLGWNKSEHVEEFKAAERKVIKAALSHGVQPRCEINSPEQAEYYINLGVRHFSLGDQMAILRESWKTNGEKLRKLTDKLQ